MVIVKKKRKDASRIMGRAFGLMERQKRKGL
jgi:hypothetical protein